MKEEDSPIIFELNLDTVTKIELFFRGGYFAIYLYSYPDSKPILFDTVFDGCWEEFQAGLERQLKDKWLKVEANGYIQYLKNNFFNIKLLGDSMNIPLVIETDDRIKFTI